MNAKPASKIQSTGSRLSYEDWLTSKHFISMCVGGSMILIREDSSESTNQPRVQWNHADGPLLIRPDGRLHWLTWIERFLFAVGRIDEQTLCRKLYKLDRQKGRP